MELLFLTLLILTMTWALGVGYPVAFALPGAAIISIGAAALCGWFFAGNVDAYFAQAGPNEWLSAGVTNLRGIYWDVERDTLIAIPLFIFMGIMLQRSRIAEDLLVTMAQLFGPVPGGLGISVVFVGGLLAATTGIVGATVVAMGLISLPAMLKNNYSNSLATGTIAASGTLGQIIPPSIVLIILADQLSSATDQASTARKALYKASTGELSMPSSFNVTSTSAGEMFLGALFPGLVLVGLYMTYILVYAAIRPKSAPAVPIEGGFNQEFFLRLGLVLIPPLALIFLVLGSIISGIATVNQAGAIGASGALLMAGYKLTEGEKYSYAPAILGLFAIGTIFITLQLFNTNVRTLQGADYIGIAIAIVATVLLLVAIVWSAVRAYRTQNILHEVMLETAKTTSLVFIILLGAAMLTAAFRAFGGEELVKNFLEGLPGGFWMKFVIVMLVIFVLGFFLDFIEIAVVVVPIVAPILLADPSANITAVWLGVMIGLNIQTSFLTPPFGFALFYLRGVAPAIVKTVQMYKGVIVFIGLQIIALLIVASYPPLVNYLPNRVSMLSDTAPPPRNPKLQYCIEDYVYDQIKDTSAPVYGLLLEAKMLNQEIIPKQFNAEWQQGIVAIEQAIAALKDAKNAEILVNDAKVNFRPLHRTVRKMESEIREIDADIKSTLTRISRIRDEAKTKQKEQLFNQITNYEQRREVILQNIPGNWEAERTRFLALQKEEDKLRLLYRRQSDTAYMNIDNIVQSVMASELYYNSAEHIDVALVTLEESGNEQAIVVIENTEKHFQNIKGTGDIQSALKKARRALDRKEADLDVVLSHIQDAQNLYVEQLNWRKSISPDYVNLVSKLEARLQDSLGIRQQPKLSREQALYIASCNSNHRDISIRF